MSCEQCEQCQNDNQVCYYRWGAANIGILACETHAKEIIMALNAAQRQEAANTPNLFEKPNE